MITFNQYIAENLEKFTKLKHLDHAEDLMIDGGEHGYQHATEALQNVHKKLQGKFNETKVTTKFDGSPSIVFGKHPENGKFFVGSKSVFNKTPKINYTDADIEHNHGESPGLAEKLKTSLQHLPKVAPSTGVYQGDYMYDKDSVHTHEKTHNFTPNTIQYSVPEKDDEGKKISAAKMGLVVHTKYHGRTLSNMAASFDPDVHKFKEHKDVHIIPHEIGGEILYPGANQKNFEHHMKALDSIHNTAHVDTFNEIGRHADHLKSYINHTVRNDEKPSLTSYREHLMNTGEKEVAGLSTASGKQRKHAALMAKLHHVETHADKFDAFFRMHNHMQKAKDSLVDALSKSSPYEHSIGGKEAKPEGFVAIHKSHPIKLVNRAEFSKANFERHK